MLSWLTQNQDHSAFENYGCHCNLSTIGQDHPFVGYRKSTSGAKDEIDWFCAQHKTCHHCLAKQTTTPCKGFEMTRLSLAVLKHAVKQALQREKRCTTSYVTVMQYY